MKMTLAALALLVSSQSFAAIHTCTMNDKMIDVRVQNSEIISAYWSNPNWGTYGAHEIDPANLILQGDQVTLINDEISEANGVYVCF